MPQNQNINIENVQSGAVYRTIDKEKIKEIKRKWYIKSNYGITIKQYEELLVKQNYECAICGRKEQNLEKKLRIDHCHARDINRGLLCDNCNTMIGLFEDNMYFTNKAIEYLNNKKGIQLVKKISVVTVKKCPRCGENDLDKFYKSSKSKSGLQRLCKECSKIELIEYRKNAKNKAKSLPTLIKTCRMCGETDLNKFYKNKNAKYGVSFYCKKCDF